MVDRPKKTKLMTSDWETNHYNAHKLYIRYKQVVSTLVLIYFVRPQLGQTTKRNIITFQTVNSDILNFDIF